MSVNAENVGVHNYVLYDELLSRREREVLGYIAEGKTDREIASLLKRSHKTIARHAENILMKLRARNRSHAVAKALTYRIIGFSPDQEMGDSPHDLWLKPALLSALRRFKGNRGTEHLLVGD